MSALIFYGIADAGQNSVDTVLAADSSHPWQLTADEIFYDTQTGEYSASGTVMMQQPERKLEADFVIFNALTREASASGNVRLTVGEDVLQSASIKIDLAREAGILQDGEIYLGGSEFYIRGKTIEQIEPYVYRIMQAEVTSCEGENPDWRKSIYYHYYEYPSVHMVPRHYGIRTQRHKLMHFYQFDEWEFYDLKEDPDELVNLYNDPEYSIVITRLKKELKDLQTQYDDDSDMSVMPKEWQYKVRDRG